MASHLPDSAGPVTVTVRSSDSCMDAGDATSPCALDLLWLPHPQPLFWDRLWPICPVLLAAFLLTLDLAPSVQDLLWLLRLLLLNVQLPALNVVCFNRKLLPMALFEYSDLMRNDTWHLVPPSSGRNIIDCKWVYKVKKKADGTVDSFDN
ncbi:hypothetical protein QYE76_052584 [Lolium multiflorum]|uniref:Reverse transcriptase Ty1/copia-type domain-containing protein n=1 Tax=Lolium multiflorum TaxID=4521 RepID=A0AAD8SVM0_LOLMU|nr:hypothetical protein QYE76_052584 [Lolium multiflorum]